MWCRWHHILRLKAIAPTYGVKELEGQLVTTMNCPDCGDEQTRVIDTETSADGTSVRRRRECQRCSFRFTTYERPEWDSPGEETRRNHRAIQPYEASCRDRTSRREA